MEATTFISTEKRCAVVTGGNKGIGLEICRQLASKGVFVILTARDVKRGCEAVDHVKASGHSDVVFHQLDVEDDASIASLAHFIHFHCKKLDILVNNAAKLGVTIHAEPFRKFPTGFGEVSDDDPDMLKGVMEQTIEQAEECIKTNYYGTKRVTEALLPYLQLSNSARIVNVTSLYGKLQCMTNEKIITELNNIESLTEERLDELLQLYLKDFKDDRLKANGWPITVSAYKFSKICISAYTRIMAKKFSKMRINCVHPGYVKTDITCHTGLLTAEEGARGPVMLALLPDDGPSGHYFNEMDDSTF